MFKKYLIKKKQLAARKSNISALSLLIIFLLFNGCSNHLKEPYENLIGHWTSEDGNRDFYFSDWGRLVIVDENRKILFDDDYHIGFVEDKTGDKIKIRIHMYFYTDYHGNTENWITYSEDKKRINSTAFGVLIYVDQKQSF